MFSHIDIPELNRGGGTDKYGIRPNTPFAETIDSEESWDLPYGIVPPPTTESGNSSDEFLDVRGIDDRGLSGSTGVSSVPTPGAVTLFGLSVLALGSQRRRR